MKRPSFQKQNKSSWIDSDKHSFLIKGILIVVIGITFGFAKTKAEFDQIYKRSVREKQENKLLSLFSATQQDANEIKNHFRWFLEKNPPLHLLSKVYQLMENNEYYLILREEFYPKYKYLMSAPQWRPRYWKLLYLQSENKSLAQEIIKAYAASDSLTKPEQFRDLVLTYLKDMPLEEIKFISMVRDYKILSAQKKNNLMLLAHIQTKQWIDIYKVLLKMPPLQEIELTDPLGKYLSSMSNNPLKEFYAHGKYQLFLNLVEHWSMQNDPQLYQKIQISRTFLRQNNVKFPILKNTLVQLQDLFYKKKFEKIILTFDNSKYIKNKYYMIAVIKVRLNRNTKNKILQMANAFHQKNIDHPLYQWLNSLYHRDTQSLLHALQKNSDTSLTTEQLQMKYIFNLPEVDLQLEQAIDIYAKLLFNEADLEKTFTTQSASYSPSLRDFMIALMVEDYYKQQDLKKLRLFYERSISRVQNASMHQNTMYFYYKAIRYAHPKESLKVIDDLLLQYPNTPLRFQILMDKGDILTDISSS